MKIVIDGFGSDNPKAVIKGALLSTVETEGADIVLVGDKTVIDEVAKEVSFDASKLEIVDATEVITNNDHPSRAIVKKKDSSLVKAFDRLKNDDEVFAMVSAGNTGAVMAGSVLLLGREDGVERPALATLLPGVNGKVCLMVDCGANVDCKASQLLSFAKFGAKYAVDCLKRENPTVALLSIGTEDEKGNALTKETFALLKESELNFVGNIEAKTVLSGEVDVIVTDGFVGNVVLKSIEGVSSTVVKTFIGLLKKNAGKDVDFNFVMKSLNDFMGIYDFNSLGGAILLGVKKLIVKTHGSSNEKTIVNAVKQALMKLN